MSRSWYAPWSVALLLALVGVTPTSAQSIEDVVGRYVGENANGFLQPLADVLGASLNSGWARSASIEPGLHVRLSAVVAGAPISDDSRTFTGTTSNFSPEGTAEVPTIFGSTESVAISGQGGTSYRFPGGLDMDLVGTIVPQLTVGTVAGTEAMVRWFGVDVDEEFGSVSLLGLGARHDIDQYLPASPLDLAAGAYWQSFDFGDVVTVSSLVAMVHASRSVGVLTLFGGLGFEKSSTDITYTQEGDTTPIDIALDASNSVRGTLGLSLNLLVLELFADYTLASQSAFTIGLGVGR